MKRLMRILAGGLALLVLLMVISSLPEDTTRPPTPANNIESTKTVVDPPAKPRPTPWQEIDLGPTALLHVQNLVEKQLKAPSTADWPGMFEKLDHVKRIGSQHYFIRSWVDSQNSFGAQLRSWYTARISQISEDQWELTFFKFDDQDEYIGSLEDIPEIEAIPPSPEELEASRRAAEAEAKRQAALLEASYRTWTSTKGKHSTEARVVSFANGTVTLKKRDGKQSKVPVDKLSEADRDYIENWRKERR